MVTTLPSLRREGGGGGGGGHHRCGSGGGGNGAATHKRQPSKNGSVLGCTCTNCPCHPRDPVKEQLCSAKIKLLKEGPRCLEPLAIPAPLPAGDGAGERLSSSSSPRGAGAGGQLERRGHRRPRRESSGKEDAAVRASMKRGVLLGVLPALFAASAEGEAAVGGAPAKQAARAGAGAGASDLEASLSSSAGGKAERKEEHTDGEEDEDEAEAAEEEERKAAGGLGLGLGLGAEGSPGWWRGQAEAYEEEEEAMWSYFAQANPRERSRMLVLRDQRRLEKLLMLTRNVVLMGLAASTKPASPRGEEKAAAGDNSSSSSNNSTNSSSRPTTMMKPEECFITGRSVRHSVHLVPEVQAQLFCCPCVSGAGAGGRGRPSQPLRGPSPPVGGGNSSGKPFELAPKEPALDMVCLPTKEIPTAGKEEGENKGRAAEGAGEGEGEGAGAAAEAPLPWLDAEDAAVDGAAEWLLQQCLFFSSGGPGAAGGDKKASSSAASSSSSSSSAGGGAGASEGSGPHMVMVLSSAALLDVARLRAAVELLVERQVWFIPTDALVPHLGPLPPSAVAAAAARNGGGLPPKGFPVTALTLPAFLARWVLAALRYHWLTATAGFPAPCPCRMRALGASNSSAAARALAPVAAARKAPLCAAGLLPAGREEQQRGDTLAYLCVATAGSSAASSCCSASCCSSSLSSASYYGFGAEAMMEMWHGMPREERLALLRRLERAIGEEIRVHLAKAGGSNSSSSSSSKGAKAHGSGSDAAALPSDVALPTPRRILLHALGLVLRPDAADSSESSSSGGEGDTGPDPAAEEQQLAALAEEEAVGEVLLEGLCLFRLPHFYAVACPRPALTPHVAVALKHALESFYADELARRLILEEEEEEEQELQGAGGRKAGGGGGKSAAKKGRRKEKLRMWLLKRQQEEQAQQAEAEAQAEAQAQAQAQAAAAAAAAAVASSPDQPIPRRPAAVVEEDAATPAEEGEREAEGKEGTEEGVELPALHSRSHSAEDSINPEAPKAVAGAGAVVAAVVAAASAAAAGKGDAAGEESEKELVGISRSTSEASAPGAGACSPTSEVEEEDEEEDGQRSSYTTSPSGSSSSGSSSSATSSSGSASAASSNSPSPTADGAFVPAGGADSSSSGDAADDEDDPPAADQGNSSSNSNDEVAEPAPAAPSTGRAMGALSPPPPLVIDADASVGHGHAQEQQAPGPEACEYYYGYGGPEGYGHGYGYGYGYGHEAEAAAAAEWSASVGRRLQLCARLSRELDEMAMGLREVSARRRPWQYCALTYLEQTVGLLWPKAHCEVYGSFTTGLSVPASDLDVVITHLPLRNHRGGGNRHGAGAGAGTGSGPGAHLLSELNDFLGAQDWVASVRCVRHAAMPIIKLTTSPMPFHMGDEVEAEAEEPDGVPRGVIKIDISLDLPGLSERAGGGAGAGGEEEEGAKGEKGGQQQAQQQEPPVHYGLQSSMFVQRLCVVHPQLPPLVLVLKQLLLQRGLSDSYTGGLSSYALSIMVAAILQPYVLEPPERQPNLGALFLTFLQTYGTATFDTGRFGVCLAPPPYGPLFALGDEQQGGGQGQHGQQASRSWKPTDPVVIQDPLRAANNVGRSCFGFRQVQVVFDQCLSRLLSYGERILAEEEARAARLHLTAAGAPQWQAQGEEEQDQRQQHEKAAATGAAIGSTEGGRDERKEAEGGEGEGADVVTAESVLGIALFGASHHRHVVDLAAASLCPPASSLEPLTAALSGASLGPAPGPAAGGGGGSPLSPPLGPFAFHQPHHQPLPQPLPFIFAVPCAAAPGVPPGAFYQWAPLPMGMHLPTILYTPAPGPHGPGLPPHAAFLPFPPEHLPHLPHHAHAPLNPPPEWCGGLGVGLGVLPPQPPPPPPQQQQRGGHKGPRGGYHHHNGPRRHHHHHHHRNGNNAVAGAGGGASPRYNSPRRERREGQRGERDGSRRRAGAGEGGQYQYQPRRQQYWESRSGPVTPTPSVGEEVGAAAEAVASAPASVASSVQA